MSLDELELALRALTGVVAVGFVEIDGLLVVEVQVAAGAAETIARDAVLRAHEHAGQPVAVEVVRWAGDAEPTHDVRLRLVEVTTDPEAGELAVRLALGEDQALGRAPMERGILAAVEATVYAVRTFVSDLPYLPGWARVIETTADRRFLVAASVTDPKARQNLRGIAEGDQPDRRCRTRHARGAEPRDQPRSRPRGLTPARHRTAVSYGVAERMPRSKLNTRSALRPVMLAA